jgi:hypothetical protein
MEWIEVNCILSALEALIEKYQSSMNSEDLSEDDRADLTNDLAYAEVLRGKYQGVRDALAKG